MLMTVHNSAIACIAALALSGLVLSGCAAPASVTVGSNPYPPAPAAQVETIPPPPVSAEPMTWQPGHWDWTGAAYAWTPGIWVQRASHGGAWQIGYWTIVNGTWTWIPAHWV